MEEIAAEPLMDIAPAMLGEGPHWHGGDRVSWVDILAGRLYLGQLTDDRLAVSETIVVDGHLGAAVPTPDGGWLLAANQGLSHRSPAGELRELTRLEPSDVRMNDAKADPAGRLWAGSMGYDAPTGAGTLWRVDLDGTITAAFGAMTISNGLGWSPDGTTMYVAETGNQSIWACDYDEGTGRLGEPRRLTQLSTDGGGPDGLCVDDAGTLWVAIYGAGEVRRYDPSGRLIARVSVAAERPTSCALVGAGRLLITTAREGMADPTEVDGRLFLAHVDAGAPPVAPYRGSLTLTRADGEPEHPGPPLQDEA